MIMKNEPIFVRRHAKIPKEVYIDRIRHGEDFKKVVLECVCTETLVAFFTFIAIVEHLEGRTPSKRDFKRHMSWAKKAICWKGQTIIANQNSDFFDVVANPQYEIARCEFSRC